MQHPMKSPGFTGPALFLLLTASVPAVPGHPGPGVLTPHLRAPESFADERGEGVPHLESAQAQLAHAASLRSSMRGKEGDARNAARKSAIEAYRAVREFFASDVRACAEAAFHAGDLLRAANDPAAALAEYQIARERGGDSPFRIRACLEIAHLHRRAQNHKEALAAYEAVIADPASTPRQRDDASYWAGHVYAAQKRIEDARRAWQRVADSAEDPLDRVRAWDCIALTYVEAGDLEAAAGTLEKCREGLSEVSVEETRLGERVRDALSTMRAIDDLQRAVEKRDKAKADGKKVESETARDGDAKKK
jgi:tetratricopeptide (TPR) repeat protein